MSDPTDTFRSSALHPGSPIPPLSAALQSFVAVDEGLDRLIRIRTANTAAEWIVPLKTKCRTLQRLGGSGVLAVTDTGFQEIGANDGMVLRTADLFPAGVVSAQRLDNGHTFFGGLNLVAAAGVTFVEIDDSNQVVRSIGFGGDYVRRSTLTDSGTILFTCDSRVFEGNWSGRIVREFSTPGFKHAWKAVRVAGDRTFVSAGYGAFLVEFDGRGRVLRRWECKDCAAQVRPHFFGDFSLLGDGGVLVCNWLGHGTGLGASGFPLLHFDANSRLVGAWQDSIRTSSLQTFVLM